MTPDVHVGDGIDIDDTWQDIQDAPHWQGDGETVDVVDDTPTGEVATEGVPDVGAVDRPDVDEGRQTRLDEWGWSA